MDDVQKGRQLQPASKHIHHSNIVQEQKQAHARCFIPPHESILKRVSLDR